MKKEVWMPHPGHFICGSRCQFRMNTYSNGYIISTVGEMKNNLFDGSPFEKIGLGRLYETMVFKATKSSNKCCPYKIVVSEQVDFAGYNDAVEAYKGHMKLLKKWKNKKHVPRKETAK